MVLSRGWDWRCFHDLKKLAIFCLLLALRVSGPGLSFIMSVCSLGSIPAATATATATATTTITTTSVHGGGDIVHKGSRGWAPQAGCTHAHQAWQISLSGRRAAGLDGCWVERMQLRGPCAASGRSEDDVRSLAAALAQPPPPRRQSDMPLVFALAQCAIHVHGHVVDMDMLSSSSPLVLFCAARHAPLLVYGTTG